MSLMRLDGTVLARWRGTQLGRDRQGVRVLLLAALCVLVSAAGAYAQIRLFGLDSDLAQGFLAAQSILDGNVLLNGWHLSPDNYYFDEKLPLAAMQAILGRHVIVTTWLSLVIYVSTLVLCIAASLRRTQTSSANLIGLAVVAILFGTLPADKDLPMLHPSTHGTGIVLSLLCLMMLARLADGGRPDRRIVAGLVLCACAAVASDPFTLVYAFGPALLVLVYDSLAGERAREPAVLAAILATCVLAGMTVPHAIAWLGGFRVQQNISAGFVGFDDLPRTLHGVVSGFLKEAGADVFGKDLPSSNAVADAIRLAGWICGVAATERFARRTAYRGLPAIDRLLLAGAVILIAACLTSRMFDIALPEPSSSGVGAAARYLTPLVVFGTILSARAVPATIARFGTKRLQVSARGALVSCAAVLLAVHTRHELASLSLPYADATSQRNAIGQYLLSRGLTCGVSDYWNASSVTALSDDTVVVRAVTGLPHHPLSPFAWIADDHWFSRVEHPMFAMWVTGVDTPANVNAETVAATYGKPARVEQAFGYSIAVLPNASCGQASR